MRGWVTDEPLRHLFAHLGCAVGAGLDFMKHAWPACEGMRLSSQLVLFLVGWRKEARATVGPQ